MELDDGFGVLINELTAAQALELWPKLEQLERDASIIDAWALITVMAVTDLSGEPVFASPEKALQAPARVLIHLAKEVLALSEISLDEGGEPTGKAEGDRSDASHSRSPLNSVA